MRHLGTYAARIAFAGAALAASGCASGKTADRDRTPSESVAEALSTWDDRHPTLVLLGNGNLAAFATSDGTDVLSRFGQKSVWPNVVNSTHWNDWDPRYMVAAGSAEAISWSPGTLHVFAPQADGSVILEA